MQEAQWDLALRPSPDPRTPCSAWCPPQPLSSGTCQSEHRAGPARTPLLPPAPVSRDPSPRPRQETGGPGPALHVAGAAILGCSSAASGTFRALVTFSSWLPAGCPSRDDAVPPESPVPSPPRPGPLCPPHLPADPQASSLLVLFLCITPLHQPGEGCPHSHVIQGSVLPTECRVLRTQAPHQLPTPSPSARPRAAPAGPRPGGELLPPS